VKGAAPQLGAHNEEIIDAHLDRGLAIKTAIAGRIGLKENNDEV
jgi:hypothetical protein